MLICVQWRCEVTYLWLNGTSSSPARPSTEPSYVRQSQSRRGSPDGFTSPTIPAASSPPPVHLVPPSNPRNCCFPPLLHRHSHRAGTITQSSQVAPPSRSASRKVISSGGGGGGGGESSCCSCCSCCCARSASLKCSGPGERDCPAWTAGQREREREREEETLGPARDCDFFCVLSFLQLTTVRRSSLIETTPPPGGVNPTLHSRSTRLHLLCARWTHPGDATFLHASSPAWVPGWEGGEGQGVEYIGNHPHF